jgi:hypothetical protein
MSIISLQQVQIASPCDASWEEMAGDDRTRFCAQCSLNVYNLSEMSQAEALIIEKEGRLCARIYRRRDGTIVTRDCPVGVALLRRAWWWSLSKTAACLMLAGSGVAWAVNSINPCREQRSLTAVQPFGTLARWLEAARPIPLGGVMMPLPLPPVTMPAPPVAVSPAAEP